MDKTSAPCTEHYATVALLREDIARLQATVSNGLLKNVAEHKEQLRELSLSISSLREILAGHIAEERALEALVNRVVNMMVAVAGCSVLTLLGISGWALAKLL